MVLLHTFIEYCIAYKKMNLITDMSMKIWSTLSTRWMIHRVEFFLIGDTPGGLSTRWTVEGGQSTPRPQSIHRWRVDHWGHSYSSSLFHFAGGEWTVDGGRWIDWGRSIILLYICQSAEFADSCIYIQRTFLHTVID